MGPIAFAEVRDVGLHLADLAVRKKAASNECADGPAVGLLFLALGLAV
jgi:hypothetical protein